MGRYRCRRDRAWARLAFPDSQFERIGSVSSDPEELSQGWQKALRAMDKTIENEAWGKVSGEAFFFSFTHANK